MIRNVEQPFGFTLIRLAFGQLNLHTLIRHGFAVPPSPVRGKAWVRWLGIVSTGAAGGRPLAALQPFTGLGVNLLGWSVTKRLPVLLRKPSPLAGEGGTAAGGDG